MSTFTLRLSFAVLCTLAATGCTADASPDEADQSEADVTAAKHRSASKACSKAYDDGVASLDSADTEAQSKLAEKARACFAKANDGAVTRIEKLLGKNDSDEQGTTKQRFAQFRSNAELLCAQTKEDVAAFDLLLCRTVIEGNLADLLDAHADLGVEATKVEAAIEGTDTWCFEDYQGAEDPIDGAIQLNACVSNSVQGDVQADETLRGTVQDTFDIQEGICGLLDGGGSDVTVASELCTVDAVLLLRQTLALFR